MKAYIVKKGNEYLTVIDQLVDFTENPHPCFIELFISREEAIENVYPEYRDQIEVLEVYIP